MNTPSLRFRLSVVFLTTMSLTGGICLAEEKTLQKMDLSKASIVTTHVTEGDEFKVEDAIDGNPSTKWVGEGHPLPWQPTNVVIRFAEDRPVAVRRVVLLTQTLREVLALKRFEIYAWAEDGTGWAGTEPLTTIRETDQLRTVVDFPPVRTGRLRIRIRDTWRSDHAFPRLAEIEVFAAPDASEARALPASPIADEKKSERLLLARALGAPVVFPGEEFDPEKGYLHYAKAFLDTMIGKGTDRYGKEHSPMFVSILDLDSRDLPADSPANIPGQRFGDRALHGGNLHHDIMLLRACDYVSVLSGNERYARAASDYLRYFTTHCPQKTTGLFPWGEHAYWDFRKESPGRLTHEFLGGVPASFWVRLWKTDENAVIAETDGLMNHVVNLRTFAFDRHARTDRPLPSPRRLGMPYLDFPRHAGFYLGAWAFAYARTGDQKYADWSTKLLDHHRQSRHSESGLLPVCTRGDRAQRSSLESMLSLAVSLLEASRLLPAGELRTRFESDGRAYGDAVILRPHRPETGQFLASAPIATLPGAKTPETASFSRPFRYGYGGGFTGDDAVLLLAAHRLTGSARALELARAFSDYYRAHEPPPPTEIVRAHVYASVMGLFLDLYDLQRKPDDLAAAERYARLAIGRLFHRGLFRGATGINHYESDMMVGNLVYNLVWLHALKTDAPTKVSPNYFNR